MYHKIRITKKGILMVTLLKVASLVMTAWHSTFRIARDLTMMAMVVTILHRNGLS